ncbi:MAG TPA: Ig-like domain-containing protein, partial [Cellulomonas sp.]
QEVFSSAARPTTPTVTDPAPRRPVQRIDHLAGTAEPGAHLTVTGRDGTLWCTAEMDADGRWACDVPAVTRRGSHPVTVSTTDDAGITLTSGRITLVVGGRPHG